MKSFRLLFSLFLILGLVVIEGETLIAMEGDGSERQKRERADDSVASHADERASQRRRVLGDHAEASSHRVQAAGLLSRLSPDELGRVFSFVPFDNREFKKVSRICHGWHDVLRHPYFSSLSISLDDRQNFTPEKLATLPLSTRDLDLRESNIDDAGLVAVAEACPYLEELVLDDCEWLTNPEMVFPKFKQLRLLSLVNRQKLTLEKLATLPRSLRDLDLSYSNIDDAGLAVVAKTCPNLERLVIEGCQELVNPGIFPKLKELFIGQANMSDAVIQNFVASCHNLEVLGLLECNLNDEVLQAIITSCPKLKKLSIQLCEELINPKINCLQLTQLRLDGCSQLTNPVINCPRLINLSIWLCHQLTTPVILGACLEDLYCSSCDKLTDVAFQAILSSCPKLKTLTFCDCDKLINPEVHCPQLIQLKLERCSQLTNPVINCPTLSALQFEGCARLTTPQVACPRLKNLAIRFFSVFIEVMQSDNSRSRLTDDVLQAVICHCPDLQRVELYGCDKLINPIIRSPRLIKLEFQWCRQLTNPVIDCPDLIGLKFNCCNQLSTPVVTCYRLKALILSYCANLTDAALKDITTSCSDLRGLWLLQCIGLINPELCCPRLTKIVVTACPKLTNPVITCPNLTQFEFSKCRQLTHLIVNGSPRIHIRWAQCGNLTNLVVNGQYVVRERRMPTH